MLRANTCRCMNRLRLFGLASLASPHRSRLRTGFFLHVHHRPIQIKTQSRVTPLCRQACRGHATRTNILPLRSVQSAGGWEQGCLLPTSSRLGTGHLASMSTHGWPSSIRHASCPPLCTAFSRFWTVQRCTGREHALIFTMLAAGVASEHLGVQGRDIDAAPPVRGFRARRYVAK